MWSIHLMCANTAFRPYAYTLKWILCNTITNNHHLLDLEWWSFAECVVSNSFWDFVAHTPPFFLNGCCWCVCVFGFVCFMWLFPLYYYTSLTFYYKKFHSSILFVLYCYHSRLLLFANVTLFVSSIFVAYNLYFSILYMLLFMSVWVCLCVCVYIWFYDLFFSLLQNAS